MSDIQNIPMHLSRGSVGRSIATLAYVTSAPRKAGYTVQFLLNILFSISYLAGPVIKVGKMISDPVGLVVLGACMVMLGGSVKRRAALHTPSVPKAANVLQMVQAQHRSELSVLPPHSERVEMSQRVASN